MRSAELEEIVQMLLEERRELEARGEGSLIERRRRLDGVADLFPLPGDVAARTIDAGGVPGRLLEPPECEDGGTLLYLHGGGYNGGSPRSHSELAARLARAAGSCALLPEYRLAPEHPFPAALDDAHAAYRWALERHSGDADALMLGGDSAGGGLALALCVRLRDAGEPLPRRMVLLSPWVDLTCSSPSWEERFDPVLDASMRDAARSYVGDAEARDPLISPLYADLRGLPPALVQVGTDEVLYDDALSLAELAERDGMEMELEIGQDLIHVWQLFPLTPEAVAATTRVGRFLAVGR